VGGCGYDRACSADNAIHTACADARQRDACLSLRLAAGNVDRYADADGNCHCHADCCANAHTDCYGDTLADPNAGFVERGAAPNDLPISNTGALLWLAAALILVLAGAVVMAVRK
jgi:hypothetical protein